MNLLTSTFIGLLLAMATIAIHALGTTWWLRFLGNWAGGTPQSKKESVLWQLKVLSLTACVLISLHMLEVVVWSVVYLFLVGGKDLTTFEEAVYFSTVTFSSLGYGDVVIDGKWRLLSAIQAMTGLLVFGWSTALLFAVVSRIVVTKIEQQDADNTRSVQKADRQSPQDKRE